MAWVLLPLNGWLPRWQVVGKEERMRTSGWALATLFVAATIVCCGGGNGAGSGGGGNSSSSSGGGNSSSGSSGGLFGNDGGGSGGSGGSGSGGTTTAQCPSGAQCNVSCSAGTTTSISGKVYDPALKDPLYNVTVYVPGGPLQPLPTGVSTGADACNCGALFKSGAVVSAATAVDGSFKLSNAPVGQQIPLVLQVGKWRRVVHVNTTQCVDNPQADKSLSLPGTLTGAGPGDNVPEIAVSTGSADTLECLMQRIGLPPSEYVAGAGGTGHVHLYAGGSPGGGGGGGGGGIGTPEMGTINALPAADTNLWDSQAHLMPYDILLLSCEGGETYNANPPALESYLNAGGRAFGSHFHYAWFAGPLSTHQNYAAPADWGNALATWTPGANGNTSNGTIVQTLNGSTRPFPKGVAFYQWLGLVNALGVLGAPAGELPINPARFNSVVTAANTPSQPWVQDDMSSNTMYFSFDTPVNAQAGPDGGAPQYCGRAVFSDLHVGGETMPPDSPPPPPVNASGCTMADLSPQEKALEFMLFDLSSCVIPDTVAPPDGGIPGGGVVQ
jgi:hypothetical protein